MSPVPPPPGTIIPSDDWTDDPSFDLSPSAAHHFALPPSSPSSSSTSSKSRQSLQSIRAHASSPLRQSFTGIGGGVGSGSASGAGGASGMGTIKAPPLSLARRDEVEEDDGMDFDLPDSFPAFPSPRNSMASASSNVTPSSRHRSSTASSSSSSIRNLSHTVVGAGPKGVGTITRLGAPPKAVNGLPVGTVRARAKALEQAWEMDVDFGPSGVDHSTRAGSSTRKGSRLTLSPPRKGFMPPADALDDLGFSDDEDQATLKAGATIKAMLPPPRPKLNSTSISKADIPLANTMAQTPPEQDPGADDEDEDFALPLNLTNLTLATQPPMPKLSRPRQSNASTNHTDWDSPGTSTSGKKSTGFWGSEDSPRGKTSETSATSASMSDGLGTGHGAGAKRHPTVKPLGQDEVDEEDDMESGLLLPSPTFFSNQRAKELNSILDRKRKPQFAPPPHPPAHSRGGTDDTLRTADESMEDGLVFDNPRVELSHHRLRHNRRTRNQTATTTPTAQTVRRGSGGTKSVAKEREKAWEKQREQGWGRHTPLPTHTRERTQSTLGLSGLRSHSASATAALKDFTPSYQRPESPLVFSRERDTPRASSRTQTQTQLSMPPPPVPPPQAAATPASGSRLRHQKSQYHLPPPQSPSLARKQSLASLQDAMSHHPHPRPPPVPDLPASIDPPPPSTSRYHASTSRLTLPTSSSRAKQRPPISSVFPHPDRPGRSDFVSGSVASSEQHMTPVPRRTRTMEMPLRAKTWGDGTELEGIEDLMVEDDPRGPALGLGRPSRRGHEPSHSRITPPKQTEEKRKKSGSGSMAKRNRNRKPALLIRNLGAVDKKKVVGDMTWNPQTLRWEGNESVLRDFDNINVASSARPALIAHYTGSSVGGVTSPSSGAGAAASTTIRIVGDMQFDPERMCWVSLADEEEPDPFEGMADDEDEESSGRGGGGGATITRALGRKLVSVGLSSSGTTTTSAGWSSRLASESGMSLAASSVMSWDERGQTGSGSGSGPVAVSKELWAECKEAEERHRKDIRGWIMRQPSGREEMRERERKEEKRLWEIRNLAMKS